MKILALLADVANGLLAVLLAAFLTNTEILWWHFFIGILCAMAPDVDALPELIRRGKVSSAKEHMHDHRELFHFPIVFILLGALLTFLSPFFGTLFLIATMLHFANDLYGTGWGVPLLWPLTNRRYKLFGRRAGQSEAQLKEGGLWDTLPDADKKFRIVVSWSKEELPRYIEKFGMDDWVEKIYFRLTPISLIEYGIFLLVFCVAMLVLVY